MVNQREGAIRRRNEEIENRILKRTREGEVWFEALSQYDLLVEELKRIPFEERMQIAAALSEDWLTETRDYSFKPPFNVFMENLDIESAADIADYMPGETESKTLLVVVNDVRSVMFRLWG